MKFKKVKTLKKFFSNALTLLLLIQINISSFAANNNDKKPLYWIDPMEPNIHYDRPGKSRMGMDVVPVYAEENNSNNNNKAPTIKISPNIINNLGIRTQTVTQGDFSRRIDTVGYIDANENAIHHIHTYANGWIKALLVKTNGEPVKKNQLLFRYFSPDLVNAQAEYLIAVESNNKDIIEAAEQKLKALGISDPQIANLKKTKQTSELIDVYSPQDGVVTELNVREGMRITPDMTLMSITDLSSIWIIVEVYEDQAPFVKTGQIAEARLPYMPEQVWRGQVEYIYPQVDPNTRTLKVRLRFENPAGILKPNMYANISLLTDAMPNILNIPIEAVIRTGSGARVIVAHENGEFEPRNVIVGLESGDRIEIRGGLKAGEKVVTSAQFLIDSEASLKGTLDRLQKPETSTSKTTSVSTNNMNNMSNMPAMSMKMHHDMTSHPAPAQRIMVIGVIKEIHADKHTLTIQHQPIPELNWPAMTMNFEVSPSVKFDQLKDDMQIHFFIEKNKNDQWMINEINIVPNTTSIPAPTSSSHNMHEM